MAANFKNAWSYPLGLIAVITRFTAVAEPNASQPVPRMWRSIITHAKRLSFIRAFPGNFFGLRGGLGVLIPIVTAITICGAPVLHAQTVSNSRSMAWLASSAETWLNIAGSDYDVVSIPQCNLDTYVSSSNLEMLQAQVLAVATPCVPLVNNKLQEVYTTAASSSDSGCSQAPLVSLHTVQLGPWQVEEFTLPNGATYEFDVPSGELGYVGYQSCDTGWSFVGDVDAFIEVWICPVGEVASLPIGNCVAAIEELSIAAGSPFIPGFSIVDGSGHVLTESELTLTVTQNDQPDPGVAVPLQSDRVSEDEIDDNGVTTSGGIASASVSTRDQPGTSTITSASSDIETVQLGVITWLPAKYALPFEITCYGVAQESLDTKGPLETLPGLPGEYHESFVSDIVNGQGTGVTLDNQFIQRGPGGKYYYRDCPRTAVWHCATAGTTVAVDPRVIPMVKRLGIFGHISIGGFGDRTAEDTGHAIKTYHIDVYWRPTAADYKDCLYRVGTSFGHTVTLLSYGG